MYRVSQASASSLVLEVARQGFGSLRDAIAAAQSKAGDPCQRLRLGSRAYCEWGLANPGWYQWMFSNRLRITASTWEELPGQPLFQMLVGSVAACLGRPAGDPECTRSAQLLWNLTHGMVSLRVARPFLPWPPLAEIVDEAVRRVVEPARLTAGARAQVISVRRIFLQRQRLHRRARILRENHGVLRRRIRAPPRRALLHQADGTGPGAARPGHPDHLRPRRPARFRPASEHDGLAGILIGGPASIAVCLAVTAWLFFRAFR